MGKGVLVCVISSSSLVAGVDRNDDGRIEYFVENIPSDIFLSSDQQHKLLKVQKIMIIVSCYVPCIADYCHSP
jgi:hypothetical protein